MNMNNLGHDFPDFKKMVIYDDLRLTIQTVMGGDGISFVSKALVKDLLEENKLVEHHVEGFCHYRHRTVVINKKSKDDEVMRDFLESIFSVFGVTGTKEAA
jgi:hypothetical protein